MNAMIPPKPQKMTGATLPVAAPIAAVAIMEITITTAPIIAMMGKIILIKLAQKPNFLADSSDIPVALGC